MNQDFINLVSKMNQGNPSPGGIALLRQVLSGLPPTKQTPNVLEIGINTGSSFIALAEFFPNASLTGIDIDEGMVSAARGNYERASELLGLGPSTIEMADATRLPYKNEEFDLVVSGGTLSFVADREAAVREIHRVLKPAGFFVSLEYAYTGGESDVSSQVSEILGFDVTETTLEYWTDCHSTANFSFEGVQVTQPFVHRAFAEGKKLEMLEADNRRFGMAVDDRDLQSMDKILSAFRQWEPACSIAQFTLRKTSGSYLIADMVN